LINLGIDEVISQRSCINARVRKRMITPSNSNNFIDKLYFLISPWAPQPNTLYEHVHNQMNLKYIQSLGFTPKNAIEENIHWSIWQQKYKQKELVEFGFEWDDMVKLGIEPRHLHKLDSLSMLDANKLFQIRCSITELADLNFTPTELQQMNFDWKTLVRMGATIETLQKFDFTLADWRRYWSPSTSQLIEAGFYDKDRILKSGWSIDKIQANLPALTERSSGRTLRLQF